MKILFVWVNDPELRANSFNSNEIKWQDHQNWFLNKIASLEYWFILELDKKEIGVIRFEFRDGNYILNYSISKEYRGLGYGRKIVEMSLDLMKQRNKNVNINAFVKKDNLPSIKIFQALNFQENSNPNEILFSLRL